ncbi:MAG TPA: hypothetical protein VMT47_05095 [Polyangia bacterium]|nr:hypothetical protein [Polyangia bacterium]
MTQTTVTGRVRATLRLKAGGADGAHVVATSWASDRSFPRTTGAAVPFELETGDGTIYRVDPFEALVALPVRQRNLRAGVRHEAAWIAVADEITVEGELERAGRARAPALRARRIALTNTEGAGALHRLPPRTLQRGDSEKIEAPAPLAPPPVATVAAAPVGGELPAPVADEASSSNDATDGPRRPKKKRPDSSGTPTPVQ